MEAYCWSERIAILTARRRAREVSRPRTSRVKFKAGENGAKESARRISEKSSAGFFPDFSRREFKVFWRVSAFQFSSGIF